MLLAGKDRPVKSIWLTCPFCNRSFRHNSAYWLGWRYGVALASGATIVVIADILVLDHNQLIALDHMTVWPWLAGASARMLEALQDGTTSAFDMVRDLALRMRDTLDQVRTAAMARLV